MKKLFLVYLMSIFSLTLHAQSASTLYDRGFLCYNSQLYNKAISLWEQCINKQYYANGDVYLYIYNAYDQSGRSHKGFKYLEEGVKLFPKNNKLTECYFLNMDEDPKEVLRIMNRISNLKMSSVLYMIKGDCYSMLGDFLQAIVNFKKSLEFDNYDNENWIFLGDAYLSLAKQVANTGVVGNINEEYDQIIKDSISAFEKGVSYAEDSALKNCALGRLSLLYETLLYYSPDSIDYKNKYEYYTKLFNDVVESE